MSRKTAHLPLVYSCSGCSSAAQLTNRLALQLDRAGEAEMSCIAGVGGGVPKLVRLARSGRPILALDGCALACVRHCLTGQGVEPAHYVQLHTLGVKKRYGEDPAADDMARVYAHVVALARQLQTHAEQASRPFTASGRAAAAPDR
ncbi:zinc-binding protein [Alkalilimnicola ehrlichii]|uniref:Zinc-binding protein n=1 Tax=Alkalilimnicola ehrlichii TaxID=351052 RepID=A0A3E0WL60_9GAMM|nr:putative zinc-binding protein [Alkalilimnicola ehrlichii]RFA25745.1 zinc-binding protein [Alkalilimnicola ehrlichii]RFA32827.1 zinc-binding protein [Alkalilimnicola ehrlichii]